MRIYELLVVLVLVAFVLAVTAPGREAAQIAALDSRAVRRITDGQEIWYHSMETGCQVGVIEREWRILNDEYDEFETARARSDLREMRTAYARLDRRVTAMAQMYLETCRRG